MQTPSLMRFDISRWLPARFHGMDDQWQALQARVFIVLLFIFVLAIIPAAITMTYVTLADILDLSGLAWVATLVVMGLSICYAYFQKSGNLKVASTLYAVLVLVMVESVIFYTGGWKSPVCLYLLTLPILVGLIVDQKTGILYAMLVFLLYSGMFLLHQTGHVFKQLVPDSYLVYTQTALWVLTLLSIVASLLLFDYSENNLSAAAASDREALECLAHEDPLTGALNEQALLDVMGRQQGLSDQQSMVIYIVVENYTGMAQQFGFEKADTFLVTVANQFGRVMVEGAVLCHYTTDEFVIYVANTADNKRVTGMLNDIRQMDGKPIMLEDGSRFLLGLNTGAFETCDTSLSPEEKIDRARQQIQNRGEDET